MLNHCALCMEMIFFLIIEAVGVGCLTFERLKFVYIYMCTVIVPLFPFSMIRSTILNCADGQGGFLKRLYVL